MPGFEKNDKREVARPVTDDIIEFISSLRADSIPEDKRIVAKHCFLDWLGVTIAGSREELVVLLRQQALEEGYAENCALIGVEQRASTFWAALINGAASHALDYDDVVSAMGGHPSVPVFSAILALAEIDTRSGLDFITAFVAGFEAECLVGTAVSPDHYGVGFHATGTVGTFGATAACAHLMSLPRPQWGHAFGLAAAQAAGLKSMFGTMTKPFHAGKAAANGWLAASLAAKGFTANPKALEASQGFIETQSSGFNEAAFDALRNRFSIGEVLFKYHAACYLTHATIEAAQLLQSEYSIADKEIEEVRVLVPESHLKVCNIHTPGSGLEGKFSLRFTTALALAGEPTDVTSFTDEKVRDARLCGLRDKVTVVPVTNLPNRYSSVVEAKCRDGRVCQGKGDVSQPTPVEALPRQWERLAEKFRSLVVPVLGETSAEAIIAKVAALEKEENLSSLISLISKGQ
ncbi:MmgE/PrpD family protein [Alloalcanivorax xenomutans]|uniref:MmgE/PrpD family protein n=1 Tax=Alloalcanivorax xenomutans TaxID=1094342 RepID=UPI0009C1E995|nr:MmgE/PrpD family protein [Alloalcanivorax xenomutans]ARB45976.1 hypothetical protein P40_11620 [Alloalcanivorax xenomutans]MCE7522040.1 MmgE/PrpD family protein [Alloalcanivorax xenomutans]